MSHATLFRPPTPEDGADVHHLVAHCPPLDPNSLYCNLLQCTHFRDTSVAALQNGQMMGFISGYRVPDRDDTLFIWQVAVDDRTRGQGLASRMLLEILHRPQCQKISYLETTITPDNSASWALFRRLSEHLEASLEQTPLFKREQHFRGQHETEMLVRIGPFTSRRIAKTAAMTQDEEITP
jgi:L-2,4-diaminobutyric acid acetyltransferase